MYKPFPIYDFASGLRLDRDPWLLAKDAFVELLNVRVNRGVLEKRFGYAQLTSLAHSETLAIGTGDGTTVIFSGTIPNVPVRPGSFIITADTSVLTDDRLGTFTGDGTGTIDYTSGVFSVTFTVAPAALLAITSIYHYYPGLPVHGIFSYSNNDGLQELLFASPKRVMRYDSVTAEVTDLTGSDIIDCDPNNLINYENWRNCLFITTGVNPLLIYDGTALDELKIDTLNDGLNHLDTCLIVIAYYSRLLLLRTYEDGVHNAQRARWCDLNNYNDWYTNGGYVDAPTNDWIIGADFIADDLIVFFENSTWALKYTGDINLPYRWEKISAADGAFSPYSLAQRRNKIIAFSQTKVVATDGLEVSDFDSQVPDQILDMNQTSTNEVFSIVLEETHEIWWSYQGLSDTINTMILAYDYDDDSWTKYDCGMKCFGQYAIQTDPTWDDTDLPWDNMEFRWRASALQAGYPLTLGGDYSGGVHIMNSSGADAGLAVSAVIKTGQLNPWGPEGYEAWLGFIDILADTDSEVILNLDFYVDGFETPFTTVTTDLIGTGTKVWKRIFVNCVGEFHTIKIHQDVVGQQFRIHALVPYMKRGGKLL